MRFGKEFAAIAVLKRTRNKKTNMKKEKQNNPKETSSQEENIKEQTTDNQEQTANQPQSAEEETESLADSEEENELNPIEKELKEAQAALADMTDKYLRLSAEFDNFRKRTNKEKAELILNGGEKAIVSLLPVVDDLERALSNMEKATDVAAVKEGTDLIYQKFMKTLAQNGVKPIETEQKELDTDFHEAIALVPAPQEEQKGKIIDCVQKGYLLNEKVIRHAKVVVGQ